MGKPSNQIFISHSSKDKKIIGLIKLGFKKRDIVPFFAREIIAGENPVEKIINAIDESIALFALMTSNSVYDSDTRDWIVFEIGVSKTKKKPIFCWMEERIAKNKVFPKLIENITDYDTFDPLKDEDCQRIVSSMIDKAIEIIERPIAGFEKPSY